MTALCTRLAGLLAVALTVSIAAEATPAPQAPAPSSAWSGVFIPRGMRVIAISIPRNGSYGFTLRIEPIFCM